MADPTLKARISGDATGLVRAAKTARSALAQTAKVGESAGKSISSAFSAVRRTAAAAAKSMAIFGGAVTAAVTASVVSFAKFEASFAQVRTLVDESQVDVQQLADGVRELSSSFGENLTKATKAAYDAISAGVDPARALEFLETAFKAASAGATDVATATDLLTSVVNSFGLRAEEVTRASDVLFATIKKGKTTAEELAQAIGQVAPIAAAAGLSVEELGAALAATTAAGLQTEISATAIKAAISGIISPSEEAGKELAKIGVSAKSLREEGLETTLLKIKEATGGLADQIALFLPNIRAQNAATILAGEGFGKFQEALRETENALGATDQAFSKTANTISFEFATLLQVVLDSIREIGENLTPAARELTASVSVFAKATRAELEVLFEVLRGRTDEFGSIVEEIGERVRDSGGGVTLALSAVGDAFSQVARVIDVLAEPVAGIVSGFDLLGRVLKATLIANLSIVLDQVSRFLRIVTFLPGILAETNAAFAELIGLDSVADGIRGVASEVETFTEDLSNFSNAVGESAGKSIQDIGGFKDTLGATFNVFRDASGSAREFGRDLRNLSAEVKEQTAETLRLKEAKEAQAKAEREAKAEADAAARAMDNSRRATDDLASSSEEAAGSVGSLGAALKSIREGGTQAAAGLSQLPEQVQKVIQSIQGIGRAKTPAQVLEEQRGQVSQLLAAAQTELDEANSRALATSLTTIQEADRVREAAVAAARERLHSLEIGMDEYVAEVEAANERYRASVASTTSALEEQRRVAQDSFQVVLDEVGKLEQGLEAIRDAQVEAAKTAGLAALQEASAQADAARETVRQAIRAGEIGAREADERIRAIDARLAEFTERQGRAFERIRDQATQTYREEKAEAEALAQAERILMGATEDQRDAVENLLELFRAKIITAEELGEGLGNLREEFAGLELEADGAGESMERLSDGFERSAASARTATTAYREAGAAARSAASEAAEGFTTLEQAEARWAQQQERARRSNQAGADLFGSFRVTGSANYQNETERRLGEASGLKPKALRSAIRRAGSVDSFLRQRGIEEFQEGGWVTKTGLAKVHAGEFVLTQGGASVIGRLLGDLLSRSPRQVVNVSPTFNVQAEGQARNLRDQARALLPELTRAVELGVAGKGVF